LRLISDFMLPVYAAFSRLSIGEWLTLAYSPVGTIFEKPRGVGVLQEDADFCAGGLKDLRQRVHGLVINRMQGDKLTRMDLAGQPLDFGGRWEGRELWEAWMRLKSSRIWARLLVGLCE
jgi:hypothetical protein